MVDEVETKALREVLREQERPAVTPTTPNASTWLAGRLRDGDEYLLNPQL